MKFSEQWLREWVNPDVSTDELVERLTMAGLEVDSIEPAAPVFSGVVVAEVLDVEAHPDADKLRVCRVSDGKEALQIVCGAPNVRVGMKAPLATVGGVMPEGFKIKKAKLRGVESFGMLCSARELGLSEDHAGLMDLPGDAPVGTNLREWLSLDDSMIEIDLTPNRGDCLGMEGVAREVGVLNRCAVKPLEFAAVAVNRDDRFPVTVTNHTACPRYLGRVIRGINPQAATPLWMQERLRRGGIRSISAAVDITNYVMLELGQPMHAFDLARLSGEISVRDAVAGEKLVLLDGSEIELHDDTLVIADSSGPLALAGIMGGEQSGVGNDTSDLFLECAFFAPEAIAGRARRYGMQTDSSYRFERGVDPALQTRAIERATSLIVEIMGGESGPVTEVAAAAAWESKAPIVLRRARLDRVVGVVIEDADVEEILQRLGMSVSRTEEGWEVSAPTFRFDIGIEADLVEEICRVYGYNALPAVHSSGQMSLAGQSETRLPMQRVRELLVDRDYREAITYSFVDPDVQAQVNPGVDTVALANPLSSEMSEMRTSLWPGLVQALRYNQHRQHGRVRLFELGLRFIRRNEEFQQDAVIAGVISGARVPEQWSIAPGTVDFFDIKGDVEALLRLSGQSASVEFVAGESHAALHPGQCARLMAGDRGIGWVGRVHPAIADSLDISADTCLFEIEQAAVESRPLPVFNPISKYPSIRRDLAMVLDEGIAAEKVSSAIRSVAGEHLQDIVLFDVYQGKGVENGRKSLALGLILQDSSRTLTEDDVGDVISRVTTHLKQELGAQLRD